MLPNGDPVGAADLASFVIEIDTPATWPAGLVDVISDIPERPESILLSWKPVAGATEYRLVISDKALFTDPLYDATRRGTTADSYCRW